MPRSGSWWIRPPHREVHEMNAKVRERKRDHWNKIVNELSEKVGKIKENLPKSGRRSPA